MADIRRGLPVVLTDENDNSIMFVALEAIGEDELCNLLHVGKEKLTLVLTAKRAQFLAHGDIYHGAVQIQKPGWNLLELQQLSGISESDHVAELPPLTQAEGLAIDGLALVKLAELLPALLMLPLGKDGVRYAEDNGLLQIDGADIRHYKARLVYGMKEVCRAPLTLEGANDAGIVAFRTLGSAREHYAIIIGTPDMANPLVRVHSSCYTGDLLGSLHCDCGDQFKAAITTMAAGQGGIILYLMQEGRGIGLTNKLRTYALQAEGMDTVDANETLGFDDDERLFLPAAKMLEALGVSTVKLLSNNPRKARGLEECGITVSACVPHVMEANQHNETYLKTKASRLGHRLPAG